MTPYATLKTGIRNGIWPSGEAENLLSAHDDMFAEGMSEIQQWVPCERDDNINTTQFCASFFKCGMTVLPAPNGVIKRVFTIANGDWCSQVFYDRVEWPEPECWSRNLLKYAAPTQTGKPALPLGFLYSDASSDATCGRSYAGIWALHNRNIYICPWIQSNEMIVVEWSGRKTVWQDTDPVSDDLLMRKTLKLFVQYAHERDFGDAEMVAGKRALYDEAVADMISDCKEKQRVRKAMACAVERNVSKARRDADQKPAAPGPLVFAQIGNYGLSGANEAAVATMVKSWGPQLILTTGNNSYNDNYDLDVGQYFSQYLFPYAGAYTPPGVSNAFWPAAGGQDWANHSLADFLSFFPTPQGRRYYEVCQGLCHFFVLDSDPSEPDGNTVTSSQAAWLQVKLALSTAKWKIVLFNRSPYASGTNGSDTNLQWYFKNWGADLVITGRDSIYERLLINGFPYLVNGLGGHDLGTVSAPITGSQAHYTGSYGALRGTATTASLLLEFINVAGVTIDSLTLTK